MGLHTGEAVPDDGDYVAFALHQAARIGDAGNGGQIVVSARTAAEAGERLPAGAVLTALGRFRVRDFDDPVELFQLCPAGVEVDVRPLRVPPPDRHNIPVVAGRFVGRRVALTELGRLIGTERITTLVGPGGTGKTRLALEAAAAVAGRYPDGVWVALLSPVVAGGDIRPTIADAVSAAPRPGERAARRDRPSPVAAAVPARDRQLRARGRRRRSGDRARGRRLPEGRRAGDQSPSARAPRRAAVPGTGPRRPSRAGRQRRRGPRPRRRAPAGRPPAPRRSPRGRRRRRAGADRRDLPAARRRAIGARTGGGPHPHDSRRPPGVRPAPRPARAGRRLPDRRASPAEPARRARLEPRAAGARRARAVPAAVGVPRRLAAGSSRGRGRDAAAAAGRRRRRHRRAGPALAGRRRRRQRPLPVARVRPPVRRRAARRGGRDRRAAGRTPRVGGISGAHARRAVRHRPHDRRDLPRGRQHPRRRGWPPATTAPRRGPPRWAW